ncbi:hypothetical protein ACFL7D_12300 [candidate division KSB1 bacterium]
MKIYCQSCGNNKNFLLPLWVRVTFKFNTDGSISILHTKQLESLEEKITSKWQLTCKECGMEAEVEFNEYENIDEHKRQEHALEGL